MKKPFAIGDMVRVYSGQDGIMVGVVEGTDDNQVMINIPGKKGLWLAHVKQCRRLVKRKPAREWWIMTDRTSDRWVALPYKPSCPDAILVREVRQKK